MYLFSIRIYHLLTLTVGEYVRWQASIGELTVSLVKVTGDSLLAAAFLSYAGPFETSYRVRLVSSNHLSFHSFIYLSPYTLA